MRTSEHASDLGSWRSASRAAAGPLRPFVHGYFGSESALPEPLRERHMPSFGVSLVLNFASPHRLLSGDEANVFRGRRAWVVGLRGDIDIGGLALAVGCSHRHLIASFREQIGVAPKAVARLLRFERAIGAINRRHDLDYPPGKPYIEGRADIAKPRPGALRWSELALACGYYDQSHFINEFRAFSGATPEALRRRLGQAGVA